MKFIEIMVPFAKECDEHFESDKQLKDFLDSGDYEIEYIYINPDAICAFNKSSDSRASTLRLVDGTTWNALIEFNEFKKMMEEL